MLSSNRPAPTITPARNRRSQPFKLTRWLALPLTLSLGLAAVLTSVLAFLFYVALPIGPKLSLTSTLVIALLIFFSIEWSILTNEVNRRLYHIKLAFFRLVYLLIPLMLLTTFAINISTLMLLSPYLLASSSYNSSIYRIAILTIVYGFSLVCSSWLTVQNSQLFAVLLKRFKLFFGLVTGLLIAELLLPTLHPLLTITSFMLAILIVCGLLNIFLARLLWIAQFPVPPAEGIITARRSAILRNSRRSLLIVLILVIVLLTLSALGATLTPSSSSSFQLPNLSSGGPCRYDQDGNLIGACQKVPNPSTYTPPPPLNIALITLILTIIITLIVVATIIAGVVIWLRWRKRNPRVRSGKKSSEEESSEALSSLAASGRSTTSRLSPARVLYRTLLQFTQTLGDDVARRTAETPAEYAQRLHALLPSSPAPTSPEPAAPDSHAVLDELTLAYMQERYQGQPVTDTQHRQLKRGLSSLLDRFSALRKGTTKR